MKARAAEAVMLAGTFVGACVFVAGEMVLGALVAILACGPYALTTTPPKD